MIWHMEFPYLRHIISASRSTSEANGGQWSTSRTGRINPEETAPRYPQKRAKCVPDSV
jgi:hypothetical protein